MLISIATASTLTDLSERTFWRRLAQGSIERVSGEKGKPMVAFEAIAPYLCISRPAEDGELSSLIKDADSGIAEAQNDLALLFLESGKARSALHWLHLAAKQGHADAMHWLGRCYIDGNGVLQNAELGIMWLAKSASCGHSISKAQISAMVGGMSALGRA